MKKPSLDFLQSIGTLLAIVISVSALFVSIYEANLMEVQQKALVWPYIKVSQRYNDKGFAFEATNNGIGPALIKSVEIRYQGTPVKSFDELLNRIKPDRQIGYDLLEFQEFNNTVLRAGEERAVFFMPWTEETRIMVEEMQQVEIRVQFCSVLEECWVFDSVKGSVESGTLKNVLEFEN